MSRRYVVTALGPDGRVQVQATHDAPGDAVRALFHLLHGEPERTLTNPRSTRNLLDLWLGGGDTFEVLCEDFQTTCSITIIDE
jgi:hypothetical protein